MPGFTGNGTACLNEAIRRPVAAEGHHACYFVAADPDGQSVFETGRALQRHDVPVPHAEVTLDPRSERGLVGREGEWV